MLHTVTTIVYMWSQYPVKNGKGFYSLRVLNKFLYKMLHLLIILRLIISVWKTYSLMNIIPFLDQKMSRMLKWEDRKRPKPETPNHPRRPNAESEFFAYCTVYSTVFYG